MNFENEFNILDDIALFNSLEDRLNEISIIKQKVVNAEFNNDEVLRNYKDDEIFGKYYLKILEERSRHRAIIADIKHEMQSIAILEIKKRLNMR